MGRLQIGNAGTGSIPNTDKYCNHNNTECSCNRKILILCNYIKQGGSVMLSRFRALIVNVC
jgi:hypothetical protein